MLTSFFAVWFALIGETDVVVTERCGPICLAVVARTLGLDTTFSAIDNEISHDHVDCSFAELQSVASKLGLGSVAVSWRNETLQPFSKTVAIVPVVNEVGRTHFVTVLKSDGRHVLVLDFPGHPHWISMNALSNAHWDGNALHFGRNETDLDEVRHAMTPSHDWQWMIAALVVVVSISMFIFHRRRGIRVGRSNSEPRSQSGGFTLVEVLVAMSIVGVLCSLLAPAIQAARERARAIECRNHLKQFGIASHAYHATFQYFPSATVPFVNLSGPVIGSDLSAQVRMLPFLEQNDLYRRIDLNETGSGSGLEPPTSKNNSEMLGMVMPSFVCPSDNTPPGSTNYRVCLGTGPSVRDKGTGPLAAKVGAFYYAAALKDRDIVDGLSTTAFFSEKLVGDQHPAVYTPNRDFFLSSGVMDTPTSAMANCQLSVGTVVTSYSYGGASWLFGGYNHTWYNHVLTPNSSTPDCTVGTFSFEGVFTARSYHPGGVHVGFGDGSTRFVNDHIDLLIWRSISSRRGREVVSLDF